VAETVFAGKQVKKLSFPDRGTFLTLPYAIVAWFAEHFFMRHRPGDACNRNRQYEEPDDL